MNTRILDYIANQRNSLIWLEQFIANYDISGDERAFATAAMDGADLHLYDAALAGDIFGKNDWTRVLNYTRSHYNWTRTIGHINITIYEAERVETQDKTPVPPRAFPLALKETSDPETKIHYPVDSDANTDDIIPF